jgi:serine O-acetyltransferase
MTIRSKADLQHYLQADLDRSGIGRWRFWSGIRYPIMRYQRLLRRTEYSVNCRTAKIWRPFVMFQLLRLRTAGIKLGFTIHPNVFGPGLSIAHWGTIVINTAVRVGANCRIHPGTSMGELRGGAPVLGDDCYIGPGARLFGPITLGDRVQVGANAVVNRSFPSDSLLVGIPAAAIASKTKDVEEAGG